MKLFFILLFVPVHVIFAESVAKVEFKDRVNSERLEIGNDRQGWFEHIGAAISANT